MLRPLASLAAAMTLAIAPIATQAAPARASAPVSAQSDDLAGVSTPGLVLGIAVFALIIILLIDDEGQPSPSSP